MRRGTLGLPLPTELPPNQTIHWRALSTREYYDYARDSDLGKRTKANLLADPRFRSIDGQMFSNGQGGSQLSADHLVAWYVYRINEAGQTVAAQDLNIFLDSPTIDLLAVLWVYGVRSKSRVRLVDDIELLPIADMPFSEEKFEYQSSTFSIEAHKLPSPEAALVKQVAVPKLLTGGTPPIRNPAVDPASAIQSKLQGLSVLMNALPGVCCMSGYQTFYCMPHTPTGAFGGSSGGAAQFDILPRNMSNFDPQYADLLSRLAEKFENLSGVARTRIEAALHRLAQAKGRLDPGDVSLDIGIALEMVLLNNEHEGQELPGQLSLHFRLRGSWLVGKTAEERGAVYKTLTKIYALRSQIAHNGFSRELFQTKYSERNAMLAEHIGLAEQVLQRLILDGTPSSWTSLILGAAS
ncbi:MAG: hypothetical protein QOF14_2414 [Hyphomicrobiales bacterium]|jgi:hypothetical protein|nr:hypothetical protein [Hyphomicrobiales bacterium]